MDDKIMSKEKLPNEIGEYLQGDYQYSMSIFSKMANNPEIGVNNVRLLLSFMKEKETGASAIFVINEILATFHCRMKVLLSRAEKAEKGYSPCAFNRRGTDT